MLDSCTSQQPHIHPSTSLPSSYWCGCLYYHWWDKSQRGYQGSVFMCRSTSAWAPQSRRLPQWWQRKSQSQRRSAHTYWQRVIYHEANVTSQLHISSTYSVFFTCGDQVNICKLPHWLNKVSRNAIVFRLLVENVTSCWPFTTGRWVLAASWVGHLHFMICSYFIKVKHVKWEKEKKSVMPWTVWNAVF